MNTGQAVGFLIVILLLILIPLLGPKVIKRKITIKIKRGCAWA
jgi:hypothetical protein